MNGDDIRALWREQPTKEIPEMSLEVLQERSGRLSRKVAGRKWSETIAGSVSMVALAVLGVWASTPLLRLSCGMLVVGEAIVIVAMWRVSATASAPGGASTKDLLSFYRDELGRERDRLLTIARWYLAPVAPGIVLLPFGVYAALGISSLVVSVVTVASTAVTYAIIIALHRRSAQRIARELASLGGSAS
jgi:hypothetical protein